MGMIKCKGCGWTMDESKQPCPRCNPIGSSGIPIDNVLQPNPSNQGARPDALVHRHSLRKIGNRNPLILLALLALVFGGTFFAIKLGDMRARDALRSPESARILARAYLLSSPAAELFGVEGDFRTYLIQNRQFFVRDGPCIRLAAAIGAAAIKYAQGAYSREAAEVLDEKNIGPVELRADVAANMNKVASNMFMFGLDMLWFAKVIPSAAEGNWADFERQDSPSRQLALQVRSQYEIYRAMYGKEALFDLIDTQLRQFGPLMEESLYQSALTLQFQ